MKKWRLKANGDVRGDASNPTASEQLVPGFWQLSHAVPKCIPTPTESYVPLMGKPLGYRLAKRTFDIVASVSALAICIAPGIILLAVVAVDTKGSPLYHQKRVGLHGKTFSLLKYRTMKADSCDLRKYLSSEQIEQLRTEHKLADDPRVTKLGAFLRRHSIDELPNFINVLAGQMSIVGPRAITETELLYYGDNVDKLLSVPCGITGLWQVSGRNAATFATGERQQLDLRYVENASIQLDIEILGKTVGEIIKGSGI